MKAQLWIFAGPNGAGKSTLVTQRVRERIPIVNPDEIARGLPPGEGQAAVLSAGRVAVAQRQGHLAAGRSFGLETTLTGHTEVDLMRRANAAGYRVNFVFVGLDNAQLSASRVHSRVSRGGHDVPLVDIFRRFDRSMANVAIALTLADRSYVFDNTGLRRRLLFSKEHGRVKHLSQCLPLWAEEAIPPELRQIRR